ncbi:MAG: hypothetical protein LAQ30_20120 [Acidobacteriia bacterium]|nr:hypothetical protein [Terriglobia bacterium]
MDARESRIAIRLLPSLADFAFLIPMVLCFGMMDGVKLLLADGDTGWHIRTGDWILAHGAVPRQDIFSFSKPGQPWYAWEWLTDVIWAGLHKCGGLALVTLASMLLISISFTIVFYAARRKSNPIVALAVTMVAAACSSLHWLARPHLFTLLFLAVFCAVLERVRSGQERAGRIPYLALLPLAMVAWTNLHGGWFVGIVTVGAYGAGELAKMAAAPARAERLAAGRRAAKYLACAVACGCATLVNPYSYHLHAHVARYLKDPYLAAHIIEFFPLNFHHPMGLFFELLLVLGAMAAFWHLAQGRFIEPIVILGWGHTALFAARNMPIFAIASAPFIAAAVQEWLDVAPELNVAGWLKGAARSFNAVSAEMAETDSIPRWRVASVAGALVLAALLYAPNPPANFRAAFNPKQFPARALEALRGNPDARVFASDQWGDYLIYRLYPRARVYTDGRSDYYGSEFGIRTLDAQNAQHNWERVLKAYQIDTVLLPPATPLAGALKESNRWRLEYDDGVALIFRPAALAASRTSSQGKSRDREITKTEASDRTITKKKPTS